MLSIIAAIGQNNELAQDGEIPWQGSLPLDTAWFRAHIAEKPVIVGRHTYQQMEQLLADQRVYLLSHSQIDLLPNVQQVADITELSTLQAIEDEVFVIGGGGVYEALLPYCSKLYITRVAAEFPDADVFFPDFKPSDYELTWSEEHLQDEENQFSFEFLIYERNTGVLEL